MKLRRRIAAVVAAMVMAVSTMAVNASAAYSSKSSSNDYVSVLGATDTTVSGTNPPVLYGTATSTATNKTTITRYMYAQANIYNSSGTLQDQSYTFKNAAAGKTVSSGKASAKQASCSYARISGVLYKTQDTTAGGQFPGVSFNMYY